MRVWCGCVSTVMHWLHGQASLMASGGFVPYRVALCRVDPFLSWQCWLPALPLHDRPLRRAHRTLRAVVVHWTGGTKARAWRFGRQEVG